ncbi:uncharacterized protein LOC142354261 isoform X2 [Convolutriloba macropyga]|uniref:uncharacterized protein LOC142354261 isoform X2 n=1 Tax=Convolutriloba macropyga TaxID=536237 RepID=UPI003F51D9A4
MHTFCLLFITCLVVVITSSQSNLDDHRDPRTRSRVQQCLRPKAARVLPEHLNGRWFIVGRSYGAWYGIEGPASCRVIDYQFHFNEYGWHYINANLTVCYKRFLSSTPKCTRLLEVLHQPPEFQSQFGEYLSASPTKIVRGELNYFILHLDSQMAVIYFCYSVDTSTRVF